MPTIVFSRFDSRNDLRIGIDRSPDFQSEASQVGDKY